MTPCSLQHDGIHTTAIQLQWACTSQSFCFGLPPWLEKVKPPQQELGMYSCWHTHTLSAAKECVLFLGPRSLPDLQRLSNARFTWPLCRFFCLVFFSLLGVRCVFWSAVVGLSILFIYSVKYSWTFAFVIFQGADFLSSVRDGASSSR